ncbi:MAG: hypothetical protein AAGC65_08385 [Mucilaginibacter sp.]|uniref:hypothetical protein n=1 Tax=Mucilaginibacter sp. TaxID=1882438 RepID=UPI0031A2AD7C
MVPHELKRAGKTNADAQTTHSNVWQVMKPFVNFGIKATGLIAGALVTVIKHIPKPETKSTHHRKNDSIIKI